MRGGISRATQITLLTVGLLAGVLIGRLGLDIGPVWIVGLGLAWLLGLIIFGTRFGFGFLLVLVVCLGVWRGYVTAPERSVFGRMVGRMVVVEGLISDDPGRNAVGQSQFVLGSVRLNGRTVGRDLRVSTLRSGMQRGYRVRVSGMVRPARGAVAFQTSFASVDILSDDVGWLERLRGRFFAASHTALPDPMGGFGLGLLVGVRALISKDLQDDLALVGLSHLVAVSGYNLTIIVKAVQRALGMLSLFASTMLSLWLVFGFLLVAGFSASIVRAAFVTLLGLWLSYYGLKPSAITVIALPAAVTVLIKPDYLVSDLGWQLSFLAFFGILVLAPLVGERWFPNANTLTKLLVESSSAHVMTLPLIMWRFEVLSVVAPLSNVMVLPLVPLAMLGAFVSGLVAMVSPPIGAWAALPTAGLLGLMIATAQWFARWPGASVKLHVDGLEVAIMYGAILALTWLLQRRRSLFVRFS